MDHDTFPELPPDLEEQFNADFTPDSPVERGRIAVIEDGEATRYFLLQSLRAQGYHVKGIEDGASALPLLRIFKPDVILLDVSLPGLDGFSVCRLIRHDPILREAIVILLTGRATPEDRTQGWNAGIDDYLIKPCDIPELLARVAAHLRRRQSPQDRWTHPITRLPGVPALEEHLANRLMREERFAACYVDIAHFKSYNQRYGYLSGDSLLAVVADMLREIAQEMSLRAPDMPAAIASHLDSDDFLLIISPDDLSETSAQLMQRFATIAPALYRAVDRDRGWVPGVDQRGAAHIMPLVSLSLAAGIYLPADFANAARSSIVLTIWHQLRAEAQTIAKEMRPTG